MFPIFSFFKVICLSLGECKEKYNHHSSHLDNSLWFTKNSYIHWILKYLWKGSREEAFSWYDTLFYRWTNQGTCPQSHSKWMVEPGLCINFLCYVTNYQKFSSLLVKHHTFISQFLLLKYGHGLLASCKITTKESFRPEFSSGGSTEEHSASTFMWLWAGFSTLWL